MMQVIGIDIGGTNFRIGCVDSDGNLTNFEKKSSSALLGDGAVDILAEEIKNYIKNYSLEGTILAVGIGVPSAVSRDKSFVYSTPNLKGLENIDLGRMLTERIDLKVFIDRDVNYLLYHDIKRYQLDPERRNTILGIYLGTGFGNAMYINGRPYAGKNGVAGEVGHTPFWKFDEPCPCGNTGCIELRCSGIWLRKLRDAYFPETDISDIFTKHGGDDKIREYIDTLAYPIATEITILDPDYVVMAGGVMCMKDFPMEQLVMKIKRKTRHPYPADNLEFVYPEPSQSAGVIGGGLSVHSELERNGNESVCSRISGS